MKLKIYVYIYCAKERNINVQMGRNVSKVKKSVEVSDTIRRLFAQLNVHTTKANQNSNYIHFEKDQKWSVYSVFGKRSQSHKEKKVNT
jgi:hypothetical protein